MSPADARSAEMDPESAGAMMVVQPRRSPEELAKLVSYLSNRQKAEITYDLVYFAAQAASENDCGALNVYLAELEDLAQVYGDPQQRRELQKTVKDVQRKTAY